jgi:hypothetical protein
MDGLKMSALINLQRGLAEGNHVWVTKKTCQPGKRKLIV